MKMVLQIDNKKTGINPNPILKKLTVEPIKFHALRHSYTTRLHKEGVDTKIIQNLIMHSNLDITLNIFTHVSEEREAETVAKLDKLFI